MFTQGIITKGIGGFYYVVDAEGTVHETRACGRFRKEKIIPRVGDRVELSPEMDAVVEILPRKSELVRPPVANVDQIVVVASLTSPAVDMYMIDAFLLSAASAGIDALLCINKSDLCTGEACEAFCEVYKKAGYETVITSAAEVEGIESLRPYLKDKVTAFAGNSGVGKSSLLNRIAGLCLETGVVSEKLARGKHTTRHVELFPLSGGGFILDTPGFSRVELPDITADALSGVYREFAAIDKECKFTGCMHLAEPGCAIKAAVADGRIHEKRYESYQYFYGKLKENKFWKVGKEETT